MGALEIKNNIFGKVREIIIEDHMLRKSTLLFLAMMAGSIFGYFFQLTMGRMLSVTEYGEMNALLSLTVIFGIPFQTLINFFAKKTAEYSANNEYSKIKTLQKKGLKKVIIIMVPILFLLFLFSGQIAHFLHVPVLKVLLIYGCVFLTAIVTLNTGVIQGLQYFYSLAAISSGIHVVRFFFGIILVWIGLGVYGAIGSILMAGFLLFLFSQWRIVKTLPYPGDSLDFNFSDVYKYAGGLFFANAFFGIMTQVDVMLVKHFFSAVDAGLYTSAAVLGKAVMYLPSAIVLSMFPMVASNHAAGNSSFSMVCKALMFTLFLSGSGALLLYFFSDFIVGALFGARYLPASDTCSLFGIAMLPVSLTFLLMNYLLAQGDTKFLYPMGVIVSLEVLAIYYFHNTLSNILYIIMAAGTLMFLILLSKIMYANYYYLSLKAKV